MFLHVMIASDYVDNNKQVPINGLEILCNLFQNVLSTSSFKLNKHHNFMNLFNKSLSEINDFFESTKKIYYQHIIVHIIGHGRKKIHFDGNVSYEYILSNGEVLDSDFFYKITSILNTKNLIYIVDTCNSNYLQNSILLDFDKKASIVSPNYNPYIESWFPEFSRLILELVLSGISSINRYQIRIIDIVNAINLYIEGNPNRKINKIEIYKSKGSIPLFVNVNRYKVLSPSFLQRIFNLDHVINKDDIKYIENIYNIASISDIKFLINICEILSQLRHENNEVLELINQFMNRLFFDQNSNFDLENTENLILVDTRALVYIKYFLEIISIKKYKIINIDQSFIRDLSIYDIQRKIHSSNNIYYIFDSNTKLKLDSLDLKNLIYLRESNKECRDKYYIIYKDREFLDNPYFEIENLKINQNRIYKIKWNDLFHDKNSQEFEVFFNLISKNQSKISNNTITSNDSLPVREPNFLLFETKSKIQMVIVDSNSQVNQYKLQKSYERAEKSFLLNQQKLQILNFSNKNITPYLKHGFSFIDKILIDANIYFNFLMAPNSKIKIPIYIGNKNFPIEVSIGSFIRAITDYWGEDKIYFANITKKNKKLDFLIQSIVNEWVISTRFAPTPSNSLHFGGVRTALLTYLLSVASGGENFFHIRFDDTNPKGKNYKKNKIFIINDLKWLGIPTSKNFSQSDKQSQLLYNRGLEILKKAKMVQNDDQGNIYLKLKENEDVMSYWVDLIKGPQILHQPPYQSYNNKELEYNLTWHTYGYRYKLAGIVDDMALNTLVLRDRRQEDNLFTARQSIILGSIREAANQLTIRGDSKDLVESFKSLANEWRFVDLKPSKRNIKPTPFYAPPFYLHVPYVVDQKKRILSKRSGIYQSIKEIREKNLLTSETIIIWFLETLGNNLLRKANIYKRDNLIKLVSTRSLYEVFEALSEHWSITDIIQSQKKDSITLGGVSKIERLVIQNLPSVKFKIYFSKLWKSITSFNQPLDLEARIFLYRYDLNGLEDIACIVKSYQKLMINSYLSKFLDYEPQSKSGYNMSIYLNSVEKKTKFRVLLYGKESGPSCSTLIGIYGSQILHIMDESYNV